MHDDLMRNGFAFLANVFPPERAQQIAERLCAALARSESPTVLRSQGRVYGCRNLLDAFPEVRLLCRHERLREFVCEHLGADAGLVRSLYFDKPPERTWSLPWHKDRTIAVRDHGQPGLEFRRPTRKAGIPHLEAPEWLLASMLTLRLHLDPMHAANGPLSVIPGSHLADDSACQEPVELHCAAGDVLAMRPLLSHCSSLSTSDQATHRRIIHLEFAPSAQLPPPYHWYSFLPCAAASSF